MSTNHHSVTSCHQQRSHSWNSGPKIITSHKNHPSYVTKNQLSRRLHFQGGVQAHSHRTLSTNGIISPDCLWTHWSELYGFINWFLGIMGPSWTFCWNDICNTCKALTPSILTKADISNLFLQMQLKTKQSRKVCKNLQNSLEREGGNVIVHSHVALCRPVKDMCMSWHWLLSQIWEASQGIWKKVHLARISDNKGGVQSRNYKESNKNVNQMTTVGFPQAAFATIGKEYLSVYLHSWPKVLLP